MALIRKQFDLDGTDFECWALITSDNVIYCKLKEFAKLLDYVTERRAFRLLEDKWKFTWKELIEKYGQISVPNNWHPNTYFVSEPGIYALMARSTKPAAKRFIHHVYEVVLPSIRRTGGYVSPDATKTQIDALIDILKQKDQQLGKQSEKIFQLAEKVVDLRPKAAVIPDSADTRHGLKVYRRNNEYRFVRTQNRIMGRKGTTARCDETLVFEKDFVANGVNVLNRLKEKLSKQNYKAKNNMITVAEETPIIQLINECIFEEVDRPITLNNNTSN